MKFWSLKKYFLLKHSNYPCFISNFEKSYFIETNEKLHLPVFKYCVMMVCFASFELEITFYWTCAFVSEENHTSLKPHEGVWIMTWDLFWGEQCLLEKSLFALHTISLLSRRNDWTINQILCGSPAHLMIKPEDEQMVWIISSVSQT